jgi:hypothetical protein
MTRFVVTLLAFAAPFVLFWLYTRWQARNRAAGTKDPWPLAVLWLTGAVLAVEAMALTAMTAPPPGGVYVPARIENGRVVPWRFETTPDVSPPPADQIPPPTPSKESPP